MKRPPIYGLLAEFENPTELVQATRRAYAAGYRKMDAFSPFAVEELSEALGFHRTRLPVVVLIGGIVGAVGGYLLQYWISAINYPINVGGKPLNSWPAFIVVTFEMTILFAAFAAVLGMLALNGLPMPYHPLFNVPRFSHVTRDGFFLCIEAVDPQFDSERTRNFLKGLNAKEISEVPH